MPCGSIYERRGDCGPASVLSVTASVLLGGGDGARSASGAMPLFQWPSAARRRYPADPLALFSFDLAAFLPLRPGADLLPCRRINNPYVARPAVRPKFSSNTRSLVSIVGATPVAHQRRLPLNLRLGVLGRSHSSRPQSSHAIAPGTLLPTYFDITNLLLRVTAASFVQRDMGRSFLFPAPPFDGHRRPSRELPELGVVEQRVIGEFIEHEPNIGLTLLAPASHHHTAPGARRSRRMLNSPS